MKKRPVAAATPSRLEDKPLAPASSSSSFGALSPASVASLCIFAGFLLAYVLFQVFPVYLNPDREMKTIQQFWPIKPIGMDLVNNMKFVRAWFVDHQTSYATDNMYPPLETLLFGPFLLLDSGLAYTTLTTLTLLCYLLLTAGLPLLILRQHLADPVVLLVTVTGLASMGFAFELERGQYNVITMFLCLGAIWLFHERPRWRWAAYVMFTLAVQLKLYPAIFILMFIEDWHDWKVILKRFALIGGLNFLCLFALGPTACLEFLEKLHKNTAAPLIWFGNHSIACNAELVEKATGIAKGALSLAMLALYALALGAVVALAWLRRRRGLNPYLLVACTIGALIIPSISHDYTLSYLAAPVVIVLTHTLRRGAASPLPRLGQWAALLAVSFAYFATTTSVSNKTGYPPFLFSTHAPMLFLVLLGTVTLCALEPEAPSKEVA